MQKQLTPHIHAEEIKAWASGKEIEVWSECNEGWLLDSNPTWKNHYAYRIKPEPKPDLVVYAEVSGVADTACSQFTRSMALTGAYYSFHNMKLTFDGETGKLKAAEVISK